VEFSYSSAPELMLAVLSQHTERIRFGHSGVLAPFKINHLLRVAERAAWVELLSRGRLEMGLARSGGTEWEAFGVDPDTCTECEGEYDMPQCVSACMEDDCIIAA